MDAYDETNGWTTVANYKPVKKTVIHVGYLWPDCLEGYVTLVSSYFPDELPDLKEVGMPCHIPNGMVLEVVEICEPTFLTVEHP